ncbi:Crp/Fnr family transcriptional regulator [Galbibacter sp. EGI 63066]|uniref:Crp/Fnr family transcriptional regulator n=1 Tax=Galbibacter sp. EGI 63066 TaxID=2993559 RepID=UPI0022495EB8|nr:Crp/Fnr family transcriptional regulator [Galbibacter sp. EGI 63066]MCX2681710.1 Crp/Fnr family transcriptional regulator [Galbibacter sp. EGI 63066]
MKEQLRTYLNRYISLTDTELNLFFNHLTEDFFSKKEYLLKPGETCKYKYFITKGLIRTFYIDEKGDEKITQFAIENWWVTNMESFTLQLPSKQYLQAIEDTAVLKIDKENLEQVFAKVPKLERAFRIMTENMLIAIQRNHDFYQKMNSKERYEHMVKAQPKFTQRVPQYMIASYLEITPEYLSSLRKGY